MRKSGHQRISGENIPEIQTSEISLAELKDDAAFTFSGQLPKGKAIFVASSRLGQNLESKPAFFDAIRTLACRLNPAENFFITADGVTADRFIRRLGSLFKIPVVCFAAKKNCEISSARNSAKNIDEFLTLIADRVYIASARTGGRIFRAVKRRLAEKLDTRLLVNSGLSSKKTENELLDAGATGWWLYKSDEATDPFNLRSRPPTSQSTTKLSSIFLEPEEIETSRFLCHWTRRRVGPWPDQREDEYLDDLIFQSSRSMHDPLASLCRILASRQLLGSNDLTRDRSRVVCFTRTPVHEIPSRRKFRSHLSRWDFEPYGIAIETSTLQKSGAREVIYANEGDYELLCDNDKPFFQLKSGRSGTDWSEEKEWRVRGDVNLRQLANDQAFIFVPDVDAAHVVSGLSNWPIVVLNACT